MTKFISTPKVKVFTVAGLYLPDSFYIAGCGIPTDITTSKEVDLTEIYEFINSEIRKSIAGYHKCIEEDSSPEEIEIRATTGDFSTQEERNAGYAKDIYQRCIVVIRQSNSGRITSVVYRGKNPGVYWSGLPKFQRVIASKLARRQLEAVGIREWDSSHSINLERITFDAKDLLYASRKEISNE